MVNSIIEILSSWEVIIIGVVIAILFPVIFYLASFEKKPVKSNRERRSSLSSYSEPTPVPTATPSIKSSMDIEMED